MNSFIKNVFKTFSSNIISLISGILVGFFIPKMMGIEGYANYKIYTLYLTYLAFTSLGLGDGLYLEYAGKDRTELEPKEIRFYMHKYYIQLLLFSAVMVICAFIFVSEEYKFIAISLGLTIISSQVISVHRNFSLLTSSFNEYSSRIIIQSISTSLLVIILYIYFAITGNEVNYKIYIIGILIIEYVMAFWYLFKYKEFSFGEPYTGSLNYTYIKLLLIGFPLLLSNMAGSIFMALDRQFVSVLFPKSDYAIYAFAYNMLTLVTTMTSAISLVVFPSMKKKKDVDVKKYLDKYIELFTILVVFCLIVYYPLSWIVDGFLKKYLYSLEVLRIVLPGLVLSSCVTVIYFNFYKLEGKIIQYFIKTLICIGVSGFFNWIAYMIFHDYKAISWASILSITIWYIMSAEYFVHKYKIQIKKTIMFMICMSILFYCITGFIQNSFLGCVLYMFSFLFVFYLLFPTHVKRIRQFISAHLGRNSF